MDEFEWVFLFVSDHNGVAKPERIGRKCARPYVLPKWYVCAPYSSEKIFKSSPVLKSLEEDDFCLYYTLNSIYLFAKNDLTCERLQAIYDAFERFKKGL